MQITTDAISLVRIQSYKIYKQTPIVKTSVSRQWHILAFPSEKVDSCLPSLQSLLLTRMLAVVADEHVGRPCQLFPPIGVRLPPEHLLGNSERYSVRGKVQHDESLESVPCLLRIHEHLLVVSVEDFELAMHEQLLVPLTVLYHGLPEAQRAIIVAELVCNVDLKVVIVAWDPRAFCSVCEATVRGVIPLHGQASVVASNIEYAIDGFL
jgi:hypothetical protein